MQSLPLCECIIAMRVAMRGCRTGRNSLTQWSERGNRRYGHHRPKRPPPPPPSPRSSSEKQQRTGPRPLPFQQSQPNPTTSTSSSKSSSSRGYEEKKQPTPEQVQKHRWLPLFGAGAAAACVGLFTVSLLNFWRTQPAEHWLPGQEPTTPTGRPSIQSPQDFDQHLDKSEWQLGVTKLRRRIVSEMVRGHVLEVAVGTGRNIEYYDWSIVSAGFEPTEEKKAGWFSWKSGDDGGSEKEKEKGKPARPLPPQLKPKPPPENENAILSFTGLDISAPSLDLALTRIRQMVPHMADQIPKKPSFVKLAFSSPQASGSSEEVSIAGNRIRLLRADAQEYPLPRAPSLAPSRPASQPQKFDTILQTFGLCSVADPISLLANLATAVQPDTGRIVLLEHGRSFWELVNGLLDRSARGHFERFGCWWNRDIELVVRAAAARVPGLEVLRLERPGWLTLGTHVLVELRVRGDVAADASRKPKTTVVEGDDGGEKPTTGWWSSLLSVGSGGGGGGGKGSKGGKSKDDE
ncbi:hypothetical protein GGR54DRAFT_587280 [Hypoxylon sp. NC1633]|nr:hypothetical protein GGR54DRAFT_587280 [Hypoxylon sp. NC1633]